MSNRPTVAQLDIALNNLTLWERFAYQLPAIEPAYIEIIKTDCSGVILQRLALYDKWLKVYPEASWNDVATALSMIDENDIAREIQRKYLPTATGQGDGHSSNEAATAGANPILSTSSSSAIVPPPSNNSNVEESQASDTHDQFKVHDDVVSELDESHQCFRGLVRKVQKEIKTEIQENNLSTEELKHYIREERAFKIENLESLQTADEFFVAIHPHYNFLSCYLIVSLATLLSVAISNEAKTYDQKIKVLMRSLRIKHIKNTLKRYHDEHQRNSSSARKVEIVVEDNYGHQVLWLVQKLVEFLFPKSPHLPWCDIVQGSIIMTFIALEHMVPSLIESSRKKTEFMKLMGFISLKIGDELVWQKNENETVLSFEDSLVRATLVNEIEVVLFLLQYAQVDINTMNANSTLISYDDEVFRETGAEYVLRSYSYVYTELLKDVEEELQQQNRADIIAAIKHPSSNALSITPLVKIADQVSAKSSIRIKKYKGSLENVKKRGMITDMEILEEYFPTPFPGSIEVIITLHSVWSNCSIWNVEQVGQLIFTPTLFHQLQWYRVDKREVSVRACLLAEGKIMNSLIECISNNEMRTSMLGVISVQIDGTVMVANDYTDGYTFGNATELARAIGDDELSDLLHQIWQSPREYKEVSTVDENNNFFFSPDPDSTPLMIACCNDNSRLVQLLLDHNADPNTRNRRDNNAIIYSTGNTKIFQMLVDSGADIFRPNFFDYTTLHFASWVGNLQVVNKILSIDKECKLLDARSSNYRRPLDVACENRHVGVVKRLLEAKALPDIQDQDGITPLMPACWNGDKEIVEALLFARANPNIQDNEGAAPLHCASRHGHLEIVEMLLQANARVDMQEGEDWTPLFGASRFGYTAIVDRLLVAKANPNIPNDQGVTPLNDASGYGHVEIVDRLLKANADPNSKDLQDRTPLISATQYNRTSIVEMLLAKNAKPNFESKDGQTALMVACANGFRQIVELLLQAKDIDLDVQSSKNGRTALMVACVNTQIVIAELLLEARANSDLQNEDGKTALDLAMETGDNQFIDRLCSALFKD